MRVDLRYNPASGMGRAERVARRFESALREAGHAPHRVAVGVATANGRRPDLLVLIGGDGTVKHAIGEAVAMDIPVYHVPLGNENLFARRYAMSRDPARLLGAIEGGVIVRVDVGVVEGSGAGGVRERERFAIMLSIGPDASVIHRMASAGRSMSGHLAYLAPIAEELEQPVLVPITAHVDGRPVVAGRKGLVVVANFPQYAFSINPAADASPSDGLLDLVFIPAQTVAPLFRAAAWGRLGRLRRLPGVVFARGRVITLEAVGGAVQVDGEAMHLTTPLRLSVEPGALQVLCPAGRPTSAPAASLRASDASSGAPIPA